MEKIYIKTKVYSGADALERLEKFEDKKIWLICDQFLVKNGSINTIMDRLKDKNKVVVCEDVIPDPPVEVIAKGVALVTSIQPDIMIAFGGGSAIDTAKGVIYFAKMVNFINKVKFIAIPTTSGTGSEVTAATVITDRQVKHLISDDDLIPDEVILCPTLTVSVPPSITANTGMDVLTHALEAYVAKKANVYSDALAEKAIELVFHSLYACYENGNDLEARNRMQEASNIAGSAFNLAGLGMNHAIAHQLGGIFHIPHGLANALLLTKIIEANSEMCKEKHRYAQIAHKLSIVENNASDEEAVEALTAYIEECKKKMKMPMRIRDCGIEALAFQENLSKISENALRDACVSTAPYTYTKEKIEKILLSIY